MNTDPEAVWFEQMPADLQEAILTVTTTANRDVAVFQRTYNGTLYVMFNSVPPELRETAAVVSSLGVTMDVLLDFWADTKGRIDLVNGAEQVMLHQQPPAIDELQPLVTIWNHYHQRIAQSPRYSEFRERLLQEWGKLLEAMRYSVLVNSDPAVPYTYEIAVEKFSPNMHHVVKHTVDMCFSPDWQPDWTPPALDLARSAQVVTRIGNWLKSWKQELRLHRDITSGVFAVALDQKLVSRHDLLDKTVDAEVLITAIENPVHANQNPVDFLKDVAQQIIARLRAQTTLPFVDLLAYAAALEQVLLDQSRGENERR